MAHKTLRIGSLGLSYFPFIFLCAKSTSNQKSKLTPFSTTLFMISKNKLTIEVCTLFLSLVLIKKNQKSVHDVVGIRTDKSNVSFYCCSQLSLYSVHLIIWWSSISSQYELNNGAKAFLNSHSKSLKLYLIRYWISSVLLMF